jgi:hypothetical protein
VSLVGATRQAALDVVATADDVAAFAESLGLAASGRTPTTYPIRWLTRPEVVDIVRALAADRPGSLPVHELQTVEAIADLPLDRPLSLTLEVRRTDEIHVSLDAMVSDAAAPVARLHAVLRLVP